MSAKIPGNDQNVICPYGGKLVDLVVDGKERSELLLQAGNLPSIQLSPRSLCDLELLATGAFSPLDRFMGKADHGRVLREMRLANDMLFPVPITLPATSGDSLEVGKEIALRSPGNELVALMSIEEVFEWDPVVEARYVCGTTDVLHPLVAEMVSWGKFYISGAMKVVNLPKHYDFPQLRRAPAQVRQLLGEMGYANVVAFQTCSATHRIDEELTKRAADEIGGALLINPVVGLTKPGDVDHYTRVRAYKVLVEKYYDRRRTVLNLLPLAMRMAGSREVLWHAIIGRNYGASHFVVGRDHAGLVKKSTGERFYSSCEAQDLVAKLAPEIGVEIIPFKELVYLPYEDSYEEIDRTTSTAKTMSISAAQVREGYPAGGMKLPEWFTRPEVADILAQVSPLRHQQGCCVWFTGLSGAGKSAVAEALLVSLMERGRQVTLLDGDVVRMHLSKGLGFSKEDRDTNILRIGFVASEIVRHNGVVICAAVSPYDATRAQLRSMVGGERFILVFVDTPLEVCEQRDSKGLYARARRGEIKGFTGIDDPYETPLAPEIVLTTTDCSPEDNARKIIEYLVKQGFLPKDDSMGDSDIGGLSPLPQNKE